MSEPISDTERTPMITPSEVLEHVYCPRFTWFMNVQNIPQHEESRFKVLKGREVHRRRATENRDYLRRKIGAVKREIEVYLASPVLRLRGIVDEVLWLKDGTMSPLDYKYTEARETVFKTHRMQIVLYAMLIREVYQQAVTRGFVAYVRDGSQLLEVPVTEANIAEARLMIEQIFDIITTGKLPRKTPHRIRCEDCCYKNICV
ncbi:MAG: CRISPR-associated protein Cas4 [Candidatus Competibacteraceae bacterium]|uniref:CRISPR-associated exonuclease Cas4 n=1 Tax=Candidatus Contendobacter odensis Run_B_J11 TaxID=1400861 RepID=A0A7U7J4P8_9GAMM|nr:CRISPR-associated protein Cas4 [Candidatus Contendobacter odensis]MBK8535366.1 CRISPR-associated protein Cas4 [Candidatus Competibacteraceae bacterium]MBK8753832.1 CRISPR-associated protein Cas4 [Candidatus Competibacteraceae bacterium]CDH46490.1 CRISPR-associated protein Cas4 [Candidatus Contendobacter odensis Run_B_J11]